MIVITDSFTQDMLTLFILAYKIAENYGASKQITNRTSWLDSFLKTLSFT